MAEAIELNDRDLCMIAEALWETLPDPHSDAYDAHDAVLGKILRETDRRGLKAHVLKHDA